MTCKEITGYLLCIKEKRSKVDQNLLNHTRGACFKQYNDLFKLHTTDVRGRTNQIEVPYKYFFEITIKKSIFYVHLMNGPTLRSNYDNNGTHCNHFHNGSKSLLVVHSILLFILKSNYLCFKLIQSSIREKLN